MSTTTGPRHPTCATCPPASSREVPVRHQASSRRRHRGAAALFVAAAVLAVPHPAAALVPKPPSPVRFPIAHVGHQVQTLAEEYTKAPLPDRRRLHDEIVLLVNAGLAAI